MRSTSHFRAGTILAVLLLVCAPRGAAAATAPTDTIRVANAAIRLGFEDQRGALVELTDAATGQAFVAPGTAPGDLWLLDLPAGGAKAAVSPTDAGRFNLRRAQGSDALILEWSDFGLPAAPDLRVTVTVRPQGAEPVTGWHIALSGLGTLGVEQVRFPRIVGIPPLGPGEEMAVPQWMGQRTKDPRAQFAPRGGPGGPAAAPTGARPPGARREWSYPGQMAIQMMALYRPDRAGLYLAADDTLAYRKSFAFWGDGSGPISYELTQALSDPSAPKDRWEQPFSSIIGTFQGDWITAVERYREWGTRQAWARNSRLDRGLVPRWLLDTGMWVWNRGRSPGVLGPAVALRETLGLPVSVFWHWWHQGPYDTSFPDYLPPREGADAFTRAVRDAQASDVHMMTYMNMRLWCTGTPSWTAEGAERWAVKGRDGTVPREVYNIFDPQACAPMDVTTEFWRNKYAGIADTVLNQYGVNGIYMDQAVLSLTCWDPTHGHPVGGGNYWMGGVEALTENIRERAKAGPELLLAGEGAGEAWLPWLDLMLTLQVSQERYSAPTGGWEPIPMFQAAYHAYGITYGSYSSLTMPPYDDLWPDSTAPAEPLKLLDPAFQRQFYLEQARSFVWGLQPTIANFLPSHLTERSRETAYMMRLAKVRGHATDWLLYGTFLRPPTLDVPEVDVHLSRVSIYAAQRSGPQVSDGRYPAAIAGAWRAKDGSVAVALASILEEPSSVGFTFDAKAYGLARGGRIFRLDENGRAEMGTFGADATPVKLDLPAGGAVVLEFREG
ncbi:MAG TPA: DUF6259 domain-containing protein [Longimicrobiales bacterium]|nr:DUF6259 domain-containing protein [Longimicrobiales bacterium]